MSRFVLGISGASGSILAFKTLDTLTRLGHEIELVMTTSAAYSAALEMGKEFGSAQKFVGKLAEEQRTKVTIHPIQDVASSICSGSYPTDGMIVIPCSMATLAAIACGLSDNVLRRAADVTIKEKRPLVIVPREAPLSEIHLQNMLQLAKAGCTICPPVPSWYIEAKTLEEMEDFIVGRVLDCLKITHTLYKRWKA